MCIRDRPLPGFALTWLFARLDRPDRALEQPQRGLYHRHGCLLYTSDAADERSSVDLGGRRIIKKKKSVETQAR